MKEYIPLVDLSLQSKQLQEELPFAVCEVLKKGRYVLGDAVVEFEERFARAVGTRYAVGVNSGFDALKLSLQALEINPGDEVILPANTFIATAMAVSAANANPVLVDIDPHTHNIDPARIPPAITKKTRAIIPVHFAGQPADLAPIVDIAKNKGLSVIEDAAQSHGALYRQRPCGSWGVMGCFSFYPSKNLGACGDGGMVTTDCPAMAERLRIIRNVGQQRKNEHVLIGVNSRLDDIQAAILKVKLQYLDKWNGLRNRHAQLYRDLLSDTGDIAFPGRTADSTHVYHLFIIETDHRDALQKHLADSGIQSGIHYPLPIHRQPAYKHLGYGVGDFPASERVAKRILSLPMYPELTDVQIMRVCDEIRKFFAAL